MKKCYIIMANYKIEDYLDAYDVFDEKVFKSIESAMKYVEEFTKDGRDGEWKISDFDNAQWYFVDLYDEEDGYWYSTSYYIQELELID